MGPTCSLAYENELPEKNSMLQQPRLIRATFFHINELILSILQGLAITGGIMTIYYFSVQKGYDESLTRSMVFTTLIMANIFLTFVNRSFYYSVFTMVKYKNRLLWVIVMATLILSAMALYFPAFSAFFKVTPLAPWQVGFSLLTAFISVIWVELWKMRKRLQTTLSRSETSFTKKNNP
jgi:Ca2+-transporting ATPase